MNRRQLLIALASAVPLAASGLLLPRRTFFLPPDGGWGLTPALILVDINSLITQMWSQSYVVKPDRILLSPYMYKALKEEGLIA